MSSGEQTKDALNQIASDIEYFKSIVNDEKEQIKEVIDQKISSSKDPYAHLQIVSDVLVDSLGELRARVKMLETVIVSKGVVLAKVEHAQMGGIETNMALLDEVDVSAERFSSDDNMYGLEQSDVGLSYVWTGPDPKTVFVVPVARGREKLLRLRFLSAIDDSFLETMKVYVDGKVIEHQLEFDGECNNVVVTLAKIDTNSATEFEIDLGCTISPAEQGKGEDQRKLGLAIVGYSVSNA